MTETFSYGSLDGAKRLAQKAAARTHANLEWSDYAVVEDSIGESACVIDMGWQYVAHVTESLGTKSIIADEFPPEYYAAIAQDTVAMIANDLVAVGAKPLTISPLWISGTSDWFENEEKTAALIQGWEKSLDENDAAWAGGETAAFGSIVHKNRILLAGSGVGIIPKERLRLGRELLEGDRIILIGSSGIHANGLTRAREIVKKLPKKWNTMLPSGRTLGEAVLTPTLLYHHLIDSLFMDARDIHYMANITGHGWAKIMRAKQPFTYRIYDVPKPPEELLFLQKEGKVSNHEAYATWNMGAGFAVFAPPSDAATIIAAAEMMGYQALDAGVVERGEKQVIITPKHVVLGSEMLNIRN